jgi:hypothetical protein
VTTELTKIRQLTAAVARRDISAVRQLLETNPALAADRELLHSCLRDAAGNDDVAMVRVLVRFGADIHAPRAPDMPEGVIDDAAGRGALNVVRWLLAQGAKVNFHVGNQVRCFPLTAAVIDGHLDVVKLLVERGGADINAVWIDQNALSTAMMLGREEIAAYLRSKGAVEPPRAAPAPFGPANTAILEHLRTHLGEPEPLVQQEIVGSDPRIVVCLVRMAPCNALVTMGMSDRPMKVPPGEEAFRFAELFMYLPLDWPVTQQALDNPQHAWPIEWIRRLAHYPHDNDTWFGGPVAVIANGEPPEPFAPDTRLSCLLLIAVPGEFGRANLPDGRSVVFYQVNPLYTEERDLEARMGVTCLLERLAERDINLILDIDRPNVGE